MKKNWLKQSAVNNKVIDNEWNIGETVEVHNFWRFLRTAEGFDTLS